LSLELDGHPIHFDAISVSLAAQWLPLIIPHANTTNLEVAVLLPSASRNSHRNLV